MSGKAFWYLFAGLFPAIFFFIVEVVLFATGSFTTAWIVFPFFLFTVGLAIFFLVSLRKRAIRNGYKPVKKLSTRTISEGMSDEDKSLLNEYVLVTDKTSTALKYKVNGDTRHPGFIRDANAFVVFKDNKGTNTLSFFRDTVGNLYYGKHKELRPSPIGYCLCYMKSQNSLYFIDGTYDTTQEDVNEYIEYFKQQAALIDAQLKTDFTMPPGKIKYAMTLSQGTSFDYPVDDKVIGKIFLDFVKYHRFEAFEEAIINYVSVNTIIKTYIADFLNKIVNG